MDSVFDDRASSDEAALLARYAGGDREAARLLAERYAPLAFRVAARMLGDPGEAEDVAQEAMLRLWRVAPGWRAGEAKVSTWLYRVTINLCTDRLRRVRGRTAALDAIPEPASPEPSVLRGLMEGERMMTLEKALAALPDRQRQAVVLRHLEELPNPAIAEIMEIGIEAVESLTARGKRALAAILAGRRDEMGYDDE